MEFVEASMHAPRTTLVFVKKRVSAELSFHERLFTQRKERGQDEDPRLQFEAVSRFDGDEKQVVCSLLEGMILKHEARRWPSVNGGANNGERK